MKTISAASVFPRNYHPQQVLVEAFRICGGSKLERAGTREPRPAMSTWSLLAAMSPELSSELVQLQW
jgi:hypothetical protein